MGFAKGNGDERRVFDRHEINVPFRLATEDGSLAGRSENLSLGGACLVHEQAGSKFQVGDLVDVEVDLAGRTARLQAEVRWTGNGRSGVMFRGGAIAAVAAFIGTLLTGSPAVAATTTVPEFDPNADIQLDMEGGSERPDEYRVLEAFEQQYEDFDRCVSQVRRGDDPLPGDVDVAVLLNPKGRRPLGVNASLTDRVNQERKLRECLRAAVAGANYPSYDGPPVVVEFSFQLDPGSVYVEE